MDEQKLLEAIGLMMDQKLQPIYDRLEILEIKQGMTHKKLDDMQFESKVFERTIRKDIAKLQDGQDTLVAVLEAKNILPKVL